MFGNFRFWAKKKTTGLIPQPVDDRDYKYLCSGVDEEEVDLRPLLNEVGNQGDLNSCVAWSVGTLMEYYLKYKKQFIPWSFDFSQAYLWYFGRLRLQKQLENSGMILRDAFKVIQQQGFTEKTYWDFKDGYKEYPSLKARVSADLFKLYLNQIPKYYSLNSCEDINNALSNGYPVVFGFPVTKGFQALSSGTQHYDKIEGQVTGYHAMLIVGFNKDYYLVRNSWGKSWGSRGYCFISRDLIASKAFDMWTLQ